MGIKVKMNLWQRLRRIWYQLKASFLLPYHLNTFLIEMNRIEDSLKYQFTFINDYTTQLDIIKGLLEYQNKLLVEVNDKLDKIK